MAEPPRDRTFAAVVLAALVVGMLGFVIVRQQQLADAASKRLEPPSAVVIPAGRIVADRGELIPFAGFDPCRSEAGVDARDCVVVDHAIDQVQVRVTWPSGEVVETWQVVREASGDTPAAWSRPRLHRADGSLVVFEVARP